MTKQELLDSYRSKAESLVKTVNSFSEEQFFKNPVPEKWSAAQNVEHLVLVTHPMIGLFLTPNVMIERWGSVNRPSVGYDEIASAYNKATGGKGKAPDRLVPQATEATRQAQLDKFNTTNEKYLAAYATLTDEQMNTYQIPHPFIGNLTVKEFMHFMSFHLDHHHKHIINALNAV